MTTIQHPAHYGGDTPFEAIKIIEAAGLGFALGNAVKYIVRHERKGQAVQDLEKARFYVDRVRQLRELPKSQPMLSLRWIVEAANAHRLEGHPRVAFLALIDFASAGTEAYRRGLLSDAWNALDRQIELLKADASADAAAM